MPCSWHQTSTFISEGRFWQSLIWSVHCCRRICSATKLVWLCIVWDYYCRWKLIAKGTCYGAFTINRWNDMFTPVQTKSSHRWSKICIAPKIHSLMQSIKVQLIKIIVPIPIAIIGNKGDWNLVGIFNKLFQMKSLYILSCNKYIPNVDLAIILIVLLL